MAQRSYYQILEVDRTATLEEIRLAFKKRALQVHPDKGGSKEAFHQVYEALETLADPAARQNYDRGLVQGTARAAASARSHPKRREAKAKAKPATKQAETPRTPKVPKPSPETQQSEETKLLTKIRDLLKCLPRDVRNDVITKHFSQKQRLILEKWMVDASSSQSGAPQVPSVNAENVTDEKKPASPDIATYGKCTVPLALPATGKQRRAGGKRTRGRKTELIESNQRARGTGTIHRTSGSGYSAHIWFDAMHMSTKSRDLQTALEFLVILTSTTQRLQNQPNTNLNFEESLDEALASSAKEQGRSIAELGVRFAVAMSSGFFLGSGFVVRSPPLSSIERFVKVRRILEPFRQYGIHPGARSGSLFQRYSPTHLCTAWQEFQGAVALAWEAAGSDSTAYLRKIRALNEASAPARAKSMEDLELRRMVLNDKKKHRPNHFREFSSKYRRHHPFAVLQHWERKHMAMNDKNKHRPPRWREPLPRKTPDEVLATNLVKLKRLLARWGRVIKRDERSAENARRSVLRKEKKVQQDRRRSEARQKQQQRKGEQMRRELLRKRTTSDVPMDDIIDGENVRLLMAQRSYYQILEVDRTATLEEIRLAFKKRALQVHPDKGGSKEAFHQVYEALETLADPAARQNYDRGLVQGTARAAASARSHPKRREAKAKAKPATKQAETPRTPKVPKPSPETQQSEETKLLTKIRDLLKCLPRDVRNDVITKHFSQKQRLILEKWMVDASSSQSRAPQVLSVNVENVTDEKKPAPPDIATRGKCTVPLALPATGTVGHKKKSQRRAMGTGTIYKEDGSYRAGIFFDAMHMYTKRCDLQTALEFLVILTSTKQRMQNRANMNTTFQENLEKALASSAREQSRSLAELGVRFAVAMSAGFLVTSGFVVRSPPLSSIEQFFKVRGILEPFRQYAIHKGARPGSLFWRYSPAHLYAAWQEFQTAVAAAWEASGLDSATYLQKIRALNEASAPLRAKNLEGWEQQHMVLNDKNKYRPPRFRERTTKHQRRERQHMALQDKAAHWPKAWRQSTKGLEQLERRRMRKHDKHQTLWVLQNWERKHMATNDRNKHLPPSWRVSLPQKTPDEALVANLDKLKRLLARWGGVLKRDERLAESARRNILRKQKKGEQDRRRLEARKRKRQREEELMRRNFLRKRMRSDVTTDDIGFSHGNKQKLARCRCGPLCIFFFPKTQGFYKQNNLPVFPVMMYGFFVRWG
eukprot:Skav225821  [mRNA]  locus=scaffold1814:50714:55862:+ [translate_table: standard]